MEDSFSHYIRKVHKAEIYRRQKGYIIMKDIKAFQQKIG